MKRILSAAVLAILAVASFSAANRAIHCRVWSAIWMTSRTWG
jgi:hypothetical protein